MRRRPRHSYEFGPFQVDMTERILLRNGEVVPLTPTLFDILLVLVENCGHILEKDEVIKTVWPDSFVEEGNITRNISTLRKALGESPSDHQCAYVDARRDPVAVGRKLKVESVLDGSIQRLGDRIRVTVQLVRARGGSPLWAEKFDEKFTDIFTVEDSISEKVAAALMLKLSREERRLLTEHYTENTEAYQLYLKGRYFWNKRTEEGLKRGGEYFQQAIDIDPNNALAYAGLADCFILLAFYSALPPKDAVPRVKAAAIRALQIDDTLADAYTSLAAARTLFDWDYLNAEREFKRAIQLNQNYATAHHRYSVYLAAMGRLAESFAEIREAHRLDSLSLVICSHVAWILFFMRQYDQAVEQCQKTLEMDPNFPLAHLYQGLAYEQKSMYQEAITEFHQAITAPTSSTQAIASLGHAYAVSGMRDEAQNVIIDLNELSRQHYVSPYDFAVIYAGLGEKGESFGWIERAYRERALWLVFLKVDPRFDGLRSDPRFTDLLRRVGLA